MEKNFARTIGYYLPYFITIITIIGIFVVFFINRSEWAIKGLILALPAIIGGIIVIYFRQGNSFNSEFVTLFNFKQKFLSFFFFLLYIIFYIGLLIAGLNNIFFILLIILLFIIIILQIFSPHPSKFIILAEIILLITIIFCYHIFTPFFYFGGTDILSHSFLTSIIVQSGNLYPQDLSSYFYFPLYHIFIAAGSEILGLDKINSIFFLTFPA